MVELCLALARRRAPQASWRVGYQRRFTASTAAGLADVAHTCTAIKASGGQLLVLDSVSPRHNRLGRMAQPLRAKRIYTQLAHGKRRTYHRE